MTIDDPASLQLHEELAHIVKDGSTTPRPILTHINADTTWLLQLPYPHDASRPVGRSRFNVLIDPWLKGPQTDVASWFSTQWHAIQSSVQSITELELYLKYVQKLTNETNASNDGIEGEPNTATDQSDDQLSYIDAVIISHEFTDHCHQATLLEIPPSVPIYATTRAAELIRSWKHFESVNVIPVFDGIDWHQANVTPLPPWLGVARVVTPTKIPFALYFHAAVSIFVGASCSPSASPEAIIYSPHGIEPSSMKPLSQTSPPIRTLALLHGLADISIGKMGQLNLGAHNALKAQRILNARYWIGTHDEDKKSGGIIAHLLRRKQITLDEAMKAEGQLDVASAECFNLGSGESRILG